MSYHGYNSSPYYGSFYSSYKNKAPTTTTRTSGNTFRSTFSPVSTTSAANNSNSSNSSRYGSSATSRSTYSTAEETPSKQRQVAVTSETSPATKNYQSASQANKSSSSTSSNYGRQSSRESNLNSESTGTRNEPTKSVYGTSTASRTTDVAKTSSSGNPSSTGASSYSLGRASNYGNLYKLPGNSTSTTSSTTSNYGNSWTERSAGRGNDHSATSKSVAGTRSNSGVTAAPSAVSESNLLSPGSYATRYSRSKSREKTPETSSKTDANVKNEVSSSTLPRSFRAYNQRSLTNTTFQSPSTYTPRVLAYGRNNPTTSRDLSYASAISSTKSAADRPYRSLLNSEPIVERKTLTIPEPVLETTKEIPPTSQTTKSGSESSDSSESDSSDDEEEEAPETTSNNFVISRGTSPSPSNESVPSATNSTLASISGSIRSPKVLRSRIPTVTVREVQTEDPESSRPRRFMGYTGSPSSVSYGSAGSSRPGSYTDRYFSKYVSPSRYTTGASPPAIEKAKSKEPSPTTTTLHKPPIPAGVGSKEFRKSALNVDLDDQQVSEFRKRQEEFREATRRAKRQAKSRKNSSGGSASSSVSPGPMDRMTTPLNSRRNSATSDKSSPSLSRSSSNKMQQQPQQQQQQQSPSPTIIRSLSRRKIVPSVKNSSSSRSSSCSSSSSGDEAQGSPETGRIKSSSSGIGSALPVRSVRKSSTSSESISRLKLSRASTDRSVASASPPMRSPLLPPSSPSKSRSPSISQGQLASRSDSSPVQQQQPQQQQQLGNESSRSQSRSPSTSVNWSKLLKMTRGPDERSSTSPESLPSKSSSSSRGAKLANASRSPSYNKMLIRSPDSANSMTRSPSSASRGHPHRVPSTASLPPGLPNRSGRTTASSSRSHIPSRNASARSIARSCSTSTDSSTSTESDRLPHSRSVSRVKDSAASSKRNSLEPSGGGSESSFAAKLASSFGWLRKQNSDIMPWWLPSTDNVPDKEHEEEEEGDIQVVPKPEESSTSSADETQSSSSTEEETQSTENKRDDTDVELDDLPADTGVTKISADPAETECSIFPDKNSEPGEELGDRSSPDGFEWPDCPATPPMTRSYPFYRRPPSPYDNVTPDIPAVVQAIQPSPSGCSMNTAWGLDALRALESLEPISIQQQQQQNSKSFLLDDDDHDDQEKEDDADEDDGERENEERFHLNEGEMKEDDDEKFKVKGEKYEKEEVEEEEESDDSSDENDDDDDDDEEVEEEEEEEEEEKEKREEKEGGRDQLEHLSKEQEATSLALDDDDDDDSASAAIPSATAAQAQLEDATFQVYKDGDYGNYLDVEATLNEQAEELEGFLENRKNSIVLRTQLSVRVHGIMDKLLHSEGRELRRALFSLKQIFQEDKDLVHEFVQNDGLSCLIRVGQCADQNFQNYILRALGQVMLYVDGMNGVMEHNPTVQWLYSLIASKYRLVAKTALKLLLVFVEYIESNCQLLVKAVEAVDSGQDMKPWSSLMRLLQERDSSDSELLVYAVTLINKTLHGLPDQDSFYDQIEFLEALGMQQIVSRFMSKPGTDTELLQQLEIYELELKQEDGDRTPFGGSDYSNGHRRTPRSWHSQRRSPRHSTNQTQQGNKRLNSFQLLQTVAGDGKSQEDEVSSTEEKGAIVRKLTASQSKKHLALLANELADKSFNQWSSSSSDSSLSLEDVKQNMLNGTQSHADLKGVNDVGVTPALRRRRERAERQRSLIREQEEAASRVSPSQMDEAPDDSGSFSLPKVNVVAEVADENRRNTDLTLSMPPLSERISNLQKEKDKDNIDRNLLDISREASVKDLTERLQANHISVNPTSPTEEKCNRLGDLSGIISKAKEELTKSKSRHDLRNLSEQNALSTGKVEPKKSENELHWESLLETLDRPLQICDLDFTDLQQEEDSDPLNPSVRTNDFGPPPPPPPPQLNGLLPPPMPGLMMPPPPPPSSKSSLPPPTFFGIQLHHKGTEAASNSNTLKNKKTVKLFWREIREDQLSLIKGPTLWDELVPVVVDTLKLEHLFESRSKDLLTKKQQETTKNKELIVLDPKRSNSINIGMTKLPPPRTIKTAILKMDSTIINREGIEKLLTMLPTDEERAKIQEAQLASPDLPLGSAEQFLLSLASITELAARLKLWLFKSDYENMEKELAEPLMDLKQGIEILQSNVTFRTILATLLAVGSFLNGAETKGFQVDYLAKVPEVKDTVHKHSLLHHLCHMVMEQNLETTDLYSEIGAVTRASRVDYDELAANLNKMEEDCKASWDHLRAIAKHDGNTTMKIKMSEFLTDCAERIMVATIVHRRVMNRFRKFLLWLGTPPAQVRESKPGAFCRVVSEFALEYRTTRDRVLQQMEKKANHRERSKTRGKMITQIGNGYNGPSYEPITTSYRTKEDRADAELRQLLGSDISDTESMRTGTWGRSRKSVGLGRSTSIRDDYLTDTVTDGDDEILESLVKTATRTPTHPRERKRSNRQHVNADRSSALRRTRKNGLSEEDRKYLITLAAQVAAA